MTEISAVVTSLRNRARKLEEFAAELERLAVNENLMSYLSPVNSQVNDKVASTVMATTVSTPVVKPPEKEKKTSRVLTCRGLRANILRYLITGEASVVTVASVVDVPFHKVKAVMTTLVHESYATKEIRTVGQAGNTKKYEVYILTDKGREEAQWFVNNPDIMIRNKQTMLSANKRSRLGMETRPN